VALTAADPTLPSPAVAPRARRSCLRHSEPVLLVGETGVGKTTVVQLAALLRGQTLHILNCNQHTEASDFLGGYRPARGRERALAALTAAAGRVAGSPLLKAAGLEAPELPRGGELRPQVRPSCDLGAA
jgi:hypothetical protein